MTVFSTLFGIIIDHIINEPGHIKTLSDGLIATDKRYVKKQMEPLVNLKYDISNIGMILCYSKFEIINFSKYFFHFLTHRYGLNGLKGFKRMNLNQNITLVVQNIKRNYDIKYIVMKLIIYIKVSQH